jgi:hypothetical protein
MASSRGEPAYPASSVSVPSRRFPTYFAVGRTPASSPAFSMQFGDGTLANNRKSPNPKGFYPEADWGLPSEVSSNAKIAAIAKCLLAIEKLY